MYRVGVSQKWSADSVSRGNLRPGQNIRVCRCSPAAPAGHDSAGLFGQRLGKSWWTASTLLPSGSRRKTP